MGRHVTSAETVFKALANENRLRIVNLFRSTGRPLCVCELVDSLGMPEYQVSRHLATLKQAGLVGAQKHGTWAYHSLSDDPALSSLWTLVDELLTGEPYETDVTLLKRRLEMRAGNHCVVGVVDRDKLLQGLQK